MANCNKLFLDFNEALSINKSKKQRMITARDNIKKKIHEHFKDKAEYSFKGTWIQGSYKMGAMIRTEDDTCDMDVGVYFTTVDDNVTASTVKDQVYKAVKDVTSSTPSIKAKCIRVNYKGDFHIDLPVYRYDDVEHDHPSLATTNDGWQESDPKEFVEWFEKKRNGSKQLVRIVRYLKAWGDRSKGKFPSGLAFSIWSARYHQDCERDDLALHAILVKIRDHIRASWFTEIPATPYDDVCSKLSSQQKTNFENALEDFVEDAEKAINSDNQLKASKVWQKYLGNRFPQGSDEDVDSKEAMLKATSEAVLAGTAKTNKDGMIQSHSGVRHKPHKNYGG